MLHSDSRILTTHTGSLPRPAAILEGMRAHEEGGLDDVAGLQRAHPRHAPASVLRLARLYGTEAPALLGANAPALAGDVGEAELDHAWTKEWARTGADFLWRRTKLGLHLAPAEQARIDAWFDARRASGAAAGRGIAAQSS